MIDLSAVRANDDEHMIEELVRCALEYRVCLVTTLPVYTALARRLLAEAKDIGISGNVGFPDGGHTTPAGRETLAGADGVPNSTWSSAWELVSGTGVPCWTIWGGGRAGQGLPVKAIIECHYLTEAQIREASDLCIEAGAAFVKTGTGWAPTGATLENVALIKQHVEDRIQIKASGGVRSLETVLEMYRRGATRFGIGLRHATEILEACRAIPPEGIAV
jgi:deoxyribose-phosphate aldolase